MAPFFYTLAIHPLIPLFFLSNFVIGVWAHRQAKVHTFQDYALASRSLPVGVLVITLIATYMGKGMLSGPDICYKDGLCSFLVVILHSISFLLIGTFIAPYLIHFEGCITMGDLMRVFYGRELQLLTGIIQAFISFLIISTELNAIGVFSEGLLGIDFLTAVLCFGVLIVVYSSWGGMRAVAYTDVLQLVGAAIFFSWIAQATIWQVGGVTTLFHRLQSDYPEKLLFLFAPSSWFKIKLGVQGIMSLGLLLTLPMVQRMLMTQDSRAVKRMWYLSAIVFIALAILIVLTGLALVLIKADLMPERVVSGSLFIEVVKHLFAAQPWVIDLMFIGFLGMLVSTIDSYLHALGISLVQDILEPARELAGLAPVPADKKPVYARLGIGFGLFSIVLTSFFSTDIVNDDLFNVAIVLSSLVVPPMVIGIVGLRTDTFSWVTYSITYVSAMGLQYKFAWTDTHIAQTIAILISVIVFFITHYMKNGGLIWLVRTESTMAEKIWIPSWQGTIASINSWLSFPFHLDTHARRQITKAPIRSLAFGLLMCLFYILSAILGSQIGGDALHTITLMSAVRFVGVTLCVVLMIEGIWPAVLQPYLPLYWFLTLWYCLPFSSTLICLLAEGGNFEISLLGSALMILFLLVDGESFLFINTLGVGMATGLYYMVVGGLPVALWNEVTYTFLGGALLYIIALFLLGFRKEGYLWDKLYMHRTAINGLEHEIRGPLNKLGLVFQYFSLASEHNGKEMEDEKGKKFLGFLSKIINSWSKRSIAIRKECGISPVR